ncbi:uncharacterized protein HKW66_Vig0083920 [Vigna angularis]|uniref:Uncharacterized protein n=1 Tax=Phaseolus angularis TaxID=3914 RepID=A0A8T0KHG2_PHAAN|nr:uncharacterized protein HKW66_Vig0083920 [Vigna angularis]
MRRCGSIKEGDTGVPKITPASSPKPESPKIPPPKPPKKSPYFTTTTAIIVYPNVVENDHLVIRGDDTHGDSDDLVIVGEGAEPESNGGVVAEVEEAVAGGEDLGGGGKDVGEMGFVDEVVVGSDDVGGEGFKMFLL